MGGDEFEPFRQLTGTALDTEITCGAARFREAMLFTHWGLSGPAVLQASLYWDPGLPIYVNLLPDTDAVQWLLDLKSAQPRLTLPGALKQMFPARFAQTFFSAYYAQSDKSIAETPDKVLRSLGERLNRWTVFPTAPRLQEGRGDPGRRGHIGTHQTMEAKLAVLFIGEVVDVTGWLGGYNFQWAWASGVAAGQSL